MQETTEQPTVGGSFKASLPGNGATSDFLHLINTDWSLDHVDSNWGNSSTCLCVQAVFLMNTISSSKHTMSQ